MRFNDNPYSSGNIQTARPQIESIAFSGFLTRVFGWMAMGLALTAGVALYVSQTQILQSLGQGGIMVLFLLLLGMVMALSVGIWRMPVGVASALYLAYAALNGVVISTIFLLYTGESIASTFFISAGMFGAMAFYGYVTKRDLTGMGSLAMMGLIGVVIASIVNIFMHSEAIYWAVTYIGVAVFLGLTAYDIQRFKTWGENPSAPDVMARGAIIGALALYLDFINLFLLLLRLFGRRR